MGYYSGNGVTVGGGKSTRTLKSFYEWGSFAIRQKCVSETVRLPGVSLQTAKAADTEAGNELTAINGGFGDLAWIIFDAEGTRKIVSYSQIGESNLYELNVTTETLSAWQSETTTRRVN